LPPRARASADRPRRTPPISSFLCLPLFACRFPLL
jgi:hypothetical protein